MLIISALSLILGVYATLSLQSVLFTSPSFVASYGPGQYQSNDLWYVGETKDIVYEISEADAFEVYTIALWQQETDGGKAWLGPVVSSKAATDDDHSSFTWTVDLYEFDLDLSNVFFFWMFNGSEPNPAVKDMPNVWSPCFNITADDPPTVSSSTSSSTTSISTSKTSTMAESTASETASSTQHPQTESATPAAENSRSSEAVSSGGISTGAGIGIGVGVGLVGISAVVCAGIIVWYKRKKRGSSPENTQSGGLHELPSSNNRQLSPKGWQMSQISSTYDALPRYGNESGGSTEQDGLAPQAINEGHPGELNPGRGWPVELDGGGRDGPRTG